MPAAWANCRGWLRPVRGICATVWAKMHAFSRSFDVGEVGPVVVDGAVDLSATIVVDGRWRDASAAPYDVVGVNDKGGAQVHGAVYDHVNAHD